MQTTNWWLAIDMKIEMPQKINICRASFSHHYKYVHVYVHTLVSCWPFRKKSLQRMYQLLLQCTYFTWNNEGWDQPLLIEFLRVGWMQRVSLNKKITNHNFELSISFMTNISKSFERRNSVLKPHITSLRWA